MKTYLLLIKFGDYDFCRSVFGRFSLSGKDFGLLYSLIFYRHTLVGYLVSRT